MCWSSRQLPENGEVRHILQIFSSICQNRMETLLNINCEKGTIPTAVTHLLLWFPCSYVDFCVVFPTCTWAFPSTSYPHAPHWTFCLFSSLCGFPHFLSLSACSRCLIHQHLLKLCVVLCINVLCPMSVSAYAEKLEESVQDYVRVAHFWLAS